jgi:hypothetical protein
VRLECGLSVALHDSDTESLLSVKRKWMLRADQRLLASQDGRCTASSGWQSKRGGQTRHIYIYMSSTIVWSRVIWGYTSNISVQSIVCNFKTRVGHVNRSAIAQYSHVSHAVCSVTLFLGFQIMTLRYSCKFGQPWNGSALRPGITVVI